MSLGEPMQPVGGTGDLDLVARSLANVMVTASEGDERIAWARWIHDSGARRGGRFVGVFPGQTHCVRTDDVDEWFARAAGGTLFIDRVASLGSQAQDRLLRLLTEQTRRTGDESPHGDRHVRVVTGSSRALSADLAIGVFSDELFYRLNVIHIDLTNRDETGDDAMKAQDIMSAPAQTCAPTTDLATVARIMWDRDCGFVPVVDVSGVVIGVVTDRDICIATATRRLLPEDISAAQVMATPIHTCHAGDSVKDVLATMKKFRIRRVPVVDSEGRLQGVISLNDIVLASTDKREPRASDVVATMASICAHRKVEAAVA